MKHLRIRHTAGPLTGRQVDFPLDRRRILVGTAPTCTVRYPATPGVTAEHCELVRDAGRYEIRVNSADPVFIDGRRADDDEELAEGSTVRLGTPDGPSFEIRYVDQATARPPGATGRFFRRLLARHRWKAAAVLVLGAIGAGMATREAVQRRRVDNEIRLMGMDRRIAEALEAATKRERDPSWPAVIERVRPSVYLMVQKGPRVGEQPMGTAWVLAPGGWLATNAHVGESILRVQRDHPDRAIVARSTVEPYAEAVVQDVQLHPAFTAFRETWARFKPTWVDASGRILNRQLVLGYDVAALRVKAARPLEAPLRRASSEALRAMRAGDPVAFVGFPVENLVEVDLSRPNPRSQIGSVVATTTFTMTKAPPDAALLIEHSIPATGGASGSPIVNVQGEVVGLLSGGNIVLFGQGRIPNAAQVNYAQRVDLLQALMSGAPPVDVSTLQEAWLADLRRYGSRDSVVDDDIARTRAAWAERHRALGAPQELRRETLNGPWNRFVGNPSFSKSFDLEAGEYFVVVRGDLERDVDASALRIQQESILPIVLARSLGADSYPLLEFSLPTKGQILISISDATVAPTPDWKDPGPKPVELTLSRIGR